jgi:hypothetical protein
MNRRIVLPALLAALALLGAPTMVTAAAPTNVTVTYDHPEKFTETQKVRSLAPQLDDDSYLKTLKSYIEEHAGKMLPPGEHLDIVVTDIDRAGNFEPWRPYPLRDVRIVKDIYPPRIDLHFQLLDADGKVLSEGTRKLRDPGFLYDGLALPGNTDSLRYEKGLIDRWLRKGPGQL